MLTLDERYLYRTPDGQNEGKPWWQQLRDFRVYFDRYAVVNDPASRILPSRLDALEPILKFYGGVPCEKIDNTTSRAVLSAWSFAY